MSEENICPGCKQQCDLDEPRCNRGEEYGRTGSLSEHDHEKEKRKSRRFHCAENYDKMDTNNKLIVNLRDLGHTMRFLFEGKGSQRRIMIILRESGGMTQRELTERIGVRPGSASEVIGKLESAGLISRTLSETDRRTADIQLTEDGMRLADEAAEQRKARHQDMFSCLSDEEKASLLALSEKLNADWHSRYRENGRNCERHGAHGKFREEHTHCDEHEHSEKHDHHDFNEHGGKHERCGLHGLGAHGNKPHSH